MAGHLASWAGTCLGSNEFVGRIKSTKTGPGSPYLKGVGIAAMSAARSKDTYLATKYRRIASRRGAKPNPDKTKQRALDQLRQMGYEVTRNPLPAAE